jgi:hypothetical protein
MATGIIQVQLLIEIAHQRWIIVHGDADDLQTAQTVLRLPTYKVWHLQPTWSTEV